MNSPANVLPLQEQLSPQSEASSLIRLIQVDKEYPAPDGPFQALKRVNLNVAKGEFVSIIGKSGAGKSTLVNMITGTDHLTSGEVWVGGVCVHHLNESRMALWRGQNIGVIYQSFHLLPGLTLLANIMLPMDFCGLYNRRESRQRAMDLLCQVELETHAYKLPSQISGGQQQRVAIARALANDPDFIIADEPTGRLDSGTAEMIYEIFERLVEQGKTIIMVTHDHTMEHRVSRCLLIRDGELFQDSKETDNFPA
jgi:putative ABC transport system ATP-binding protein